MIENKHVASIANFIRKGEWAPVKRRWVMDKKSCLFDVASVSASHTELHEDYSRTCFDNWFDVL